MVWPVDIGREGNQTEECLPAFFLSLSSSRSGSLFVFAATKQDIKSRHRLTVSRLFLARFSRRTGSRSGDRAPGTGRP